MTEDKPFDPEAFTLQAKEAWDDASERYEAISLRFFPPITRKFLQFAGLPMGGQVLDVACGPGTATMAAAGFVGADGMVTGADLSPVMLELAKKRAKQRLCENIEFQQCSADALPFGDKNFDAVICQLGLMLFSQPGQALDEMSRVTKKGGQVTVLVQGLAENMQFTSIMMRALIKKAPDMKVAGGPTLFGFGPKGKIVNAMLDVGLQDPEEMRLTGTFDFPSAEEYWNALSKGGGRTRLTLSELSEADQEAVKKDFITDAEGYKNGSGIAIPYEFVMARGKR